MEELHRLLQGVSHINNDYLCHKLKVFTICVCVCAVQLKACLGKIDIEK